MSQYLLECFVHLPCMLISFAHFVSERTVNYLCNGIGNARVTSADRDGLPLQDDLNLIQSVGMIAWVEAGQDVVAGGPHSPDIADRLEAFKLSHLLAGHKLKGTDLFAGDGQSTETRLLKVFREAQIG